MIFSWRRWNEEHIEKHGVSPEEAEYVVNNARSPFPRVIGDGKLLVWGRTIAGRHLQVIYVHPLPERVDLDALRVEDRDDFQRGRPVAFVIHAMELDDEKKQRYRKLRGRR